MGAPTAPDTWNGRAIRARHTEQARTGEQTKRGGSHMTGSDTEKPALVMPGPMMPHVIEQLEREFTVHKLWLAEDPDALMARVADTIVAVATAQHGPIDARFMSRLPRLAIVASFGVGYDTVDADWAGRNGVLVTNTPDVLSEEVADTAMALLLMAARELPPPSATCARASGKTAPIR